MLQQTQVDRVIPYYGRFLQQLPTIAELAAADIDDVLGLWAGLGYYSRARHLHAAAQMIVRDFDGQFPPSPEDVARLTGVGEYTQGAICSIAFGQPLPALDANARRVIARIFGIEDNIRKGTPKREVQRLGAAAVDPHRPGDYNQAVMELGALLCTSGTPDCQSCPVQEICRAKKLGIPEAIPPAKKTETVRRRFVAGLIARNGRYAVRQRPLGGVWGGLWEFPNVEVGDADAREILLEYLSGEFGLAACNPREIAQFTYGIMNQQIELTVFEAASDIPSGDHTLTWMSAKRLSELAFPSPHARIVQRIQRGGLDD